MRVHRTRHWATAAGLLALATTLATFAEARPFYVLRAAGDARVIVDPTTIESVEGGAVRRMWLVTVQGNILNEGPPQPGYVRALNAYDCAAQKSRWEKFTAFSRSGQALLSRENPDPAWASVTAENGMLGEWRVACGLSAGDSVIAGETIAKVVVALMRTYDLQAQPPVAGPSVRPPPKVPMSKAPPPKAATPQVKAPRTAKAVTP